MEARGMELYDIKFEFGYVGDEVILCGLLTKYGSTYETSSGKAYIYSHNGKTE